MTLQGKKSLLKAPIVVAQGATNVYAYKYSLQVDSVVTAVDLSDWTAASQIRDKVGGNIWVDLTNENGIALGSDGSIVVTITPEMTDTDILNRIVTQVFGVWDLELKDPDTKIVRFLKGTVTFDPDVTRSA